MIFSKNTTCPLLIFKRAREQNPPLLRWQRAGFLFLFSRKKKKGLKGFMVWSALPTASQSTHFMNIKYSVLYFTWKWLPERAKMPTLKTLMLFHLKKSIK